MLEPFTIEFDYTIDEFSKTIHLTGQVEIHHAKTHYVVANIMTRSNKIVLPNQYIKKFRGKWVHVDSQHPSRLSISIGKAIDGKLAQ